MKYANLGATGLSVSRICLGMMTYGSSKWRDWVLDYDQSRPFVEAAIEAGINRGGYTVYFLDPDEITLELVQPPLRTEQKAD